MSPSLAPQLLLLSAFATALALPPHGQQRYQYSLVSRGNISMNKPAFATLPCADYRRQTGKDACPDMMAGILLVTSFQFAGSAAIFHMNLTAGPSPSVSTVPGSDSLMWPNRVVPMGPADPGLMIVGDGFLVPKKNDGGLYMLDMDALGSEGNKLSNDNSTALRRITPDEKVWFYHQGFPYDLDGDGDLDILAARAQKPPLNPFAKKSAELVWVENVGDGDWELHVVDNGPDFLFCVREVAGEQAAGARAGNQTAVLQFVAPEFYGKTLVMYTIRGVVDGKMDFDKEMIDGSLGPGFGCEWTDLDGDGVDEILATNHKTLGGSVYAYQQNDKDSDPSAPTFSRHELASGFKAHIPLPTQASPGAAFSVHPEPGNPTPFPHIIVSGDNENDVVHLIPEPGTSEAGAFNWKYTKETFFEAGADVGQIAADDVDGNGFTDVFIPVYGKNMVMHYEFERR